ncbi:NupC/NupG family nucleoside CNT transporter [Psychroflexus sp. ALD_RP9]|uniref:NupC/NupG family nucleoside CNT transporter n=1 Tax=Psychroflexus sp. ALD_RP9 TaxID=2777186 RepID=UPI001F5DBB6E|nr:nucleoside transporter C-terminal domain-containing protein [Psychroflexus sp. ALD_RP9]
MKIKLLSLLLLCCSILNAQEISGIWVNESQDNQQKIQLDFEQSKLLVLKKTDTLLYSDITFNQNELKLLRPNEAFPAEVFNMKVDSKSLQLHHKDTNLNLVPIEMSNLNISTKEPLKASQKPSTKDKLEQNVKTMVPHQGFTVNGLWRGFLGMITILLIAFLFSSNRKAINWKTVGVGLTAQLILAIGVLKVKFVQAAFDFVGKIFVKILEFTAAGSEFLLGGLMDVESYGYIFLFQVLPTIIFFSALTSLLFYLGIIQIVVKGLAKVLTKLLGISGAESLSVAGNIFLGQTESPLMIKAYLERMTRSEILLVMIGGMATVAGGVLAAYIGFLGGDDEVARLEFAKHLLAASVMAAPGAIVISKILYPQQDKINSKVEVSLDKIGSNVLDAIANGTTEGLKLAANVGAMLLVFVALIAMINYGLNFIGDLTTFNQVIAEHTPYDNFSLEAVLGTVFAPLMWLIGVAKDDVMLMGQLLGIKLAASEFVGYIQLAELKDASNILSLNYQKSVIMATYMLCGFANFASIGIQIGGIGSLAPGQRKTLSEFGFKALIGGTLASLMSATIAGMIIG